MNTALREQRTAAKNRLKGQRALSGGLPRVIYAGGEKPCEVERQDEKEGERAAVALSSNTQTPDPTLSLSHTRSFSFLLSTSPPLFPLSV